MSPEMQKQKPSQDKPTQDSADSQQSNLKEGMSDPSLPNQGTGKEVRFQASPATSSHPPFPTTEMSQVPGKPIVHSSVPQSPLVQLLEPDVSYPSLPREESRPSEPLLDRPLKMKRQ